MKAETQVATTRHLWCRGSSGQQFCIWYDDYDGDDDDCDDVDDSEDEDDGDGDDYISRTLKTRLSKQKHRWQLLVVPRFLGSTIFAIESKQHRIDMNSRFHQLKQTKLIHSNN